MRSGIVALVAGVALAVLGGVGYLLLSHAFREREAPRVVAVDIGGQRLSFKSAYLRAGGDGAPIELAAFFPGFAPAGRVDDVDAHTDLDARFDRTVFLSLRPAGTGIDPQENTVRLYERFLEQDSWSHPGGLTARAFQSGSPFEGDELYYAPPEGRKFAARCGRPDPERKTPNTCVYAFRYAGLDVDLRFTTALLSDWEALTDGARGLIEAARQ